MLDLLLLRIIQLHQYHFQLIILRWVYDLKLKRFAKFGKYHTGSTAAFPVDIWPLSCYILPSAFNVPSLTISIISGMSICALVTAIVGRTSIPCVKYFSLNACLIL